jgi:N-acetylmuramoyl-L-alanine amidase
MNGNEGAKGLAGWVDEILLRVGKWWRGRGAITSAVLCKDPLASRRDILRGVYEENLAILGRRVPAVKRKHPRGLTFSRVFMCTVACLFIFLSYAHFFEGSSPTSMPMQETVLMHKESDPGAVTSFFMKNRAKIHPAAMEAAMTAEYGPGISGDYFSATESTHGSSGMDNLAELKPLEMEGPVPLRRMLGLGVRRITIDAGHGGEDIGAVGSRGTMEKDITLDIARRLKNRLIQSGFLHVHMTREDDSDVSLQERVESARAAKADLFVSIHVNWLPNTPVNVIETFYFGPSNDQRILDLAERENRGSEYGLSEFQELLEKLGKKMKLQESRELAEHIQASLYYNRSKNNEDIRDNGVKRAPFVVLLGPDVPSVLVEVSCLSNEEEEHKLNTENHRENVAGHIAAGIANYLHSGVSSNDIKR